MQTPNIPQVQRAGMTVGSLRFLIHGLDDMTPISVQWEDGHAPGDDDPAVRVFGFSRDPHSVDGALRVLVGLVRLCEYEEGE